MKIMHKPIGVRSKIEELLEKEGKELVHISYGSADCKTQNIYVGIAFNHINPTKPYNDYSVFTYNTKTDSLAYREKDIYYENALIAMGNTIKSISFLN